MSNVAEKLIIMADNTPAVVEAVNAAKTTASGTAIRVDDVLNVEHGLSVQLKSKNLVDFVGLLGEGYTNELNGLSCLIENGYAVITGTHNIAGWTNILQASRFTDVGSEVNIVLPAGTYSLSTKLKVQLNSPATGKSTNYEGTFTITEPHRLSTFYIAYNKEGTVVDAKIPLMIIEGDVIPTEYTPYTTDFSGVGVEAYGKNLLSVLSKWNGKEPVNNATPIYLKGGQQYTFSHNGDYTAWRLMMFGTDMDGTPFPTGSTARETANVYLRGFYTGASGRLQFSDNTTGGSYKFICNKDCIIYAVQFWVTGTENTPYTQYQLELGSTATGYETYRAPQEATADASGKVDGLISVSPSMTLLADSDAVALECTYFPESAAGVYAKYHELKQEQINLQNKLQVYKEESV